VTSATVSRRRSTKPLSSAMPSPFGNGTT
jgi:hypothetical protein